MQKPIKKKVKLICANASGTQALTLRRGKRNVFLKYNALS